MGRIMNEKWDNNKKLNHLLGTTGEANGRKSVEIVLQVGNR